MLRYLLCAFAAAGAAAASAGIALTLSTIGAQSVINSVTPSIEALLSNITLPNINTSSNDVNIQINNAGCNSFSISETPVISISPGGGMTIVAVGLQLSCSLDWAFQTASWPYTPSGAGSASADVASATAVAGVLITASANGSASAASAPNAPHARLQTYPVLSVTNMTLIIGELGITFQGSAWDWLLDLVRDLFKTSIQNSVASALSAAVSSFIDGALNAALAGVAYSLPLPLPPPYNISEIRFDLAADPVFDVDFAAFPLLGDVVPVSAPVAPPVAPPNIPSFGVSSGAPFLQLFLSAYTAQSGAYTFMQAGLLSWLLPPSALPFALNASEGYAIIAPGLPAAFPNATISLALRVAALPNVSIAPSAIGLDVALDATFLANGATPAFTLSADCALGLTVALRDNATSGALALDARLDYASSALSLVSSAVGPVSVALLQALMDFVLGGVLLPLVNAALAGGVPLPALPFATLYNTFLTVADGYIVIATDFSLNAAAMHDAAKAAVASAAAAPTAAAISRADGSSVP